ncbi:MAG: hypothetical protein AAF577_05310 [Pseudomonadota bacterium]
MMPMLFAPTPEDIADGYDEPEEAVQIAALPDALDRMAEPGTKAAEAEKAVIFIDYPLSEVAEVTLSPADGKAFTTGEIVAAIGEAYRAIYEAEGASQTSPTPSMSERGQFLNRPPSHGTFGVWGHDLEDLYLEGVHLYRAEGVLWIEPQMGS